MHNLSLFIHSESVTWDSPLSLIDRIPKYAMSTSIKGQMLPTSFLHGHYAASSILPVGLTSNRPRDFLTLEGLEITSSALLDLPGSSRLPCKHAVLLDTAEAVLLLATSSMLSSPALYRLDLRASQIFFGALSPKGDYPHPTAYLLPVYASRLLLPEPRKTRYRMSGERLVLV